jgi:hypothetical protein
MEQAQAGWPAVITVIHERPPNFDAIVAALPFVKHRKGVLFTYDNAVYNPDHAFISPWLAEHEATHVEQQRAMGAPAWWERYLADKAFRLEEEAAAMVAEYRAFCRSAPAPNRARRAEFLDALASRLSSLVYGYMIRKKDAKRLFKQRIGDH